MTALVHQLPQTPAQPDPIPPHVLTVGKKRAAEYVAPALFRLGTFGELLVKARGSLSIATAVDVAEMVKRDIAGLAQAITIGTTEIVINGINRAASFIEIHLMKSQPATEIPSQELPEAPQTPALEAPEPVPALAAPIAAEAPKKKKKSAKKKSKTATKKAKTATKTAKKSRS
jgi:DNA-binding protein Alba